MTRPPVIPPAAPTTAAQLLVDARTRLERLSAEDAHAAMRAGAVLVDIRSDRQRATDGTVPGSHFVSRNVAEWRLDPTSAHRDPLLAERGRRLVLLCDEGYQSSLLAATAQRFGLRAMDVIGGFRAWRAAGLPVQAPPSEDALPAIGCPCGHHLEGADGES